MKRLIIIGNGFDLAHGMNTRYTDFRDFVKKRFPNLYEQFLYIIKGECDNLWNKIEDHFSTLKDTIEWDIKRIREEDGYDYDSDYDFEPWKADSDRAAVLGWEIENKYISKKNIRHCISEWLKTVSKPTLYFSKVGDALKGAYKIINFNYTDTIESKYGLVCDYIHGSSRCIDDISFGASDVDVSEHNLNFKSMWGEGDDYSGLYKDNYTKNVRYNIKKYIHSLDKDIDSIIIIGHSVGKQDLHYFRAMLSTLKSLKEVIFIYYSDEDLKNINAVMSGNNLDIKTIDAPDFYK